jgi:phosphoribosylaminoimidazolecarboxamide formyltransferase/IMP cyclohydrolase
LLLAYDEQALEILKSKANSIILVQKNIKLPKKQIRTLLNGIIEQDKDANN